MAVTPLLHAFIEINKQLAKAALGGMTVIDLEQCVLKVRGLRDLLRDIARQNFAGNCVAAAGFDGAARRWPLQRLAAVRFGGNSAVGGEICCSRLVTPFATWTTEEGHRPDGDDVQPRRLRH